MKPALPKEVSSAAPRRSSRQTERPRFCRCSATLMPTMPAPRTTTSARTFLRHPEGELLDVDHHALVQAVADQLFLVFCMDFEKNRPVLYANNPCLRKNPHPYRRGGDVPHVEHRPETLVARRQVPVHRVQRRCLE